MKLIRLVLAGFAMLGIAAMAPSPASAAPATTAAVPYVSYRAAFSPNQALSVGAFSTPVAMARHDLQFGISDWRKETTTNGIRLHNRFYAQAGIDACLAGSGKTVINPECALNSSAIGQNWRLVPIGAFVRLQHAGTGLYLTYPAGGSGPVFLAALGPVQTQAFTERFEGNK